MNSWDLEVILVQLTDGQRLVDGLEVGDPRLEKWLSEAQGGMANAVDGVSALIESIKYLKRASHT